MKYDIFAGMGGGFGGATYQTTEEFNTEKQANEAAYERACEIFEGYAGQEGIKGWNECIAEAEEEISEEDCEDLEEYRAALKEYADEVYNGERENWVECWVEESTGKYNEE